MFAAGLALFIGLVVRSWGEDDEPATAGSRAAVVVAADPLSYPGMGLRLLRPPRWTAERRGGVLYVRAPGRDASVALTSDPRGTPARAVRRHALRLAGRSLSPVRETGRSTLAFGGLRARATELRGTAPAGGRLAVVVAAAEGRWRTYGLTIVRSEDSSPVRLKEIALLLRSIRIHRVRARGAG